MGWLRRRQRWEFLYVGSPLRAGEGAGSSLKAIAVV
jgi:hypothetical protein